MNKAHFFLFFCSISLIKCVSSDAVPTLQSHISSYFRPAFLAKCTVTGGFAMYWMTVLLSKDPHFSKNSQRVQYSTYVGLPLLGALGGFVFGRHEQNCAVARLKLFGV